MSAHTYGNSQFLAHTMQCMGVDGVERIVHTGNVVGVGCAVQS